MVQDNNERYEDILKRIANRKPFEANKDVKKPSSIYDTIVDSLNMYDMIARLTQKQYQHIICHGPKIVTHKEWSGVVIWYRPKGYYGYQMLYLLGTWIHQVNENIQLTIGVRELSYRAAVYNPEGYFASIRKGFTLFYKDNGHPPSPEDTILFESIYTTKERLTLRQTLEKCLSQWQQEIETD